jgi:hypothetical protein
MSLFLAIIFTLPMSLFALETDNYISLGHKLSDSRAFINAYLRSEISEVLKDQKKSESCSGLRFKLAKRWKSIGVKHNPLENALVSNLPEGAVYPRSFNYVHDSIYRDPFLPYSSLFGLSPNVQVSGIYFGTDKFSHFASTGFTYFLIYSSSLRSGRSEEESLLKAITFGLKDEQSLHGFWASGVFSYADLEANFQGLLFYKNLCGMYLKRRGEWWSLGRVPDIKDYVSGFWDETFNRSYFLEGNWQKIKPFIKYYNQFPKRAYQHERSFSQIIVDQLKEQGDLPLPQVIF